MIESIYKQIITFIPISALHAGTVLLLGWFAGSVVQNLIDRWMAPRVSDKTIIHLLSKTFKYVIFSLGCISALAAFGINIQSILAGFGLTGFAVGFALKDTLANTIAGIFILVYRPFKIGQEIKIATSKSLYDQGIVKKIDLRYTTLENDTEIALVPNSILFTTSITIFKKK